MHSRLGRADVHRPSLIRCVGLSSSVPVMAMSKRNANAMVIMNFLYRIVEVFEDYFNELVEESIRDNFVITYELLDEMMDFGYPQSTEPKVLKEYICVEERHKFVAKPPVAVTNAVSWRGEGIKVRHAPQHALASYALFLSFLTASHRSFSALTISRLPPNATAESSAVMPGVVRYRRDAVRPITVPDRLP
jgi:hypothetical protein